MADVSTITPDAALLQNACMVPYANPVRCLGLVCVAASERKRVRSESIVTIRSMDVVVPVQRVERVIHVKLPYVAKPDKDVECFSHKSAFNCPTG
jgi:hypothetical protein